MIRRRLVLGVTATVAIAILLASWLVVTSLERQLIENIDAEFSNGSVNVDLRDQLLDRGPGPDRLDERRPALPTDVLSSFGGPRTAGVPSCGGCDGAREEA